MISEDGQDFQNVIQEKSDEVHTMLSKPDFLEHYILETLNSFAFRYFDNPQVAKKKSTNLLAVGAIEVGIKEAIKIKNDQLRTGLGDLVKKFSKDQNPTVYRELSVELDRAPGAKAGKAIVRARISWGHPEHQFQNGTYVEKKTTLVFEDEVHLRNKLALDLDLVSELF